MRERPRRGAATTPRRPGEESGVLIAPRAQLEQFEPISLPELDRLAPLRARVDRKYLLRRPVLDSLLTELVPAYAALELAGVRSFRYESVYFDTPDLTLYRAHVQGRRKRFKCRTRHYVESGLRFAELKLKDGRRATVKRRRLLAGYQGRLLSEDARKFLDGELRREYGARLPATLRPTLTTAFVRVTLVSVAGHERVTCDAQLRLHRDGATAFELEPDSVLVETKTANGNGHVDRLLRRLGARPLDACSKYCLGVALTREGIRDNLFRRFLRQAFVPAGATVSEGALP